MGRCKEGYNDSVGSNLLRCEYTTNRQSVSHEFHQSYFCLHLCCADDNHILPLVEIADNGRLKNLTLKFEMIFLKII